MYVNDQIQGDVCSNDPYAGNRSDMNRCFFEIVTKAFMINFSNNLVDMTSLEDYWTDVPLRVMDIP